MSLMRKGIPKIWLVILLCGSICTAFLIALFHGYFDHGDFRVDDEQWSSSKELAIVARRSDHSALNGDQYFVLIGKTKCSTQDLKHAYYGRDVAFRAGSNCLKVRWERSHHLVITCADHSINPDEIAIQQHEIGDVMVSYENIPPIPKVDNR